MRLVRARDHEQARGVAVEPVDDAGAPRLRASCDRLRQEAVDERAVRMTCRRMHDDARRLVDDEQMLVPVGDPEALHLLRLELGLTARRKLGSAPRRRPAGGSSAAGSRRRARRPRPPAARPRTASRCPPARRSGRGARRPPPAATATGARATMTLRWRGVLSECDARTQGALVAGGYGRNRGRRSAPPKRRDGTRLIVDRAPDAHPVVLGAVRRRRGWRSADTSAASRIATPTTMNESARLKAGQNRRSRKSVTCPSRSRSIRFARPCRRGGRARPGARDGGRRSGRSRRASIPPRPR